nr:MAG TPA: holin [Caudoviricetes sp.]
MNINWKVRIKNPVWWAEVVAAIVLPMLAAVGLSWNDITSWEALLDVLKAAIGNPVTVVAVLVSVWNAVTDPTTKGISDSQRAMCYFAPAKDVVEDD